MERFSPLSFKDKPNPSPPNSASATPGGKRRSAFGQALPRTAPVAADTGDSRKRRENALFNVPDWRSEDDIIIEAARRDPTIQVPERLRPRVPRVIESREVPRLPREISLAPHEIGLEGTKDTLREATHEPATHEPATERQSTPSHPQPSETPSGKPHPQPETKPPTKPGAPTREKSLVKTDSKPHEKTLAKISAEQPAPTTPPLLRILYGSKASGNAMPVLPAARIGEDIAGILGNLAALTVPTLCVLLLSGWGPKEVAIIFEDFWSYLGLALGLTVILVTLDLLAQAVAARLSLAKPGEWFLEFGLSSLGVGVCLFFFTFSALGALLLALVMSVLTSLVSVLVSKIF